MTRNGTSAWQPTGKLLGRILGVAALYFITGKLGTRLALPPGYATAIWPPSGIALAAVLVFGYSVWPGICLGSCLVNLPTTLHALSHASAWEALLVLVSIGLGASLEAVVGAFFVKRFVGFPDPLEEERKVIWFLILGGPLSCFINATMSVTILSMVGVIPWTNYPINWGTWWIGDSIGVIILTPMILIAAAARERKNLRRAVSVVLPLCVTFVLVVFLFIFSSGREQRQARMEFHEKAGDVQQALQMKFERYLDMLHVTQSLFQSGEKIDRQSFHRFVENERLRYPGVQALIWAPYQRDRVVPLFREPAPENGAVSVNLATDPIYKEAVQQARDTGDFAATERQEVLGNGGPAIFLPVFAGERAPDTPAERKKLLRGFVAETFHSVRVIESALSGVNRRGIGLRIEDEAASPSQRLLYLRPSSEEGRSSELGVGIESNVPLEMAGRRWNLQAYETVEYLIAHRTWHAWSVLLLGLLFTGILGAFLLIVTGRTLQVESLVALRTASLRASESKFRLVLQSAQEAIVTASLAGDIVSWNRAAELIFGYRPSEILGKPLVFILPEFFPIPAIGTFARKSLEVKGKKKDGNEIPLELSLAVWEDQAGRFFSCFLRDITERKRIDQMKTDFVSFASHQLRTPIAEIKGLVENMLGGLAGNLPDWQKKYLEMIQTITFRTLRLIKDLLNASKIMGGMVLAETKPVPLKVVADQLIEEYHEAARKKEIDFHLEELDKNVMVNADLDKLTEALRNVVENALRFTNQGSIIVLIRSNRDFGFLEISDSGSGISESSFVKLFSKEAVFSGSPAAEGAGTGLGLYIAKSFIELQKGDITATTVPGKGSTFTFKLPKVREEDANDGTR